MGKIITDAPLVISLFSLWYSRRANIRADESSRITLQFEQHGEAIWARNTGDRNITALFWRDYPGEGSCEVLGPGQTILVRGAFEHIFSEHSHDSRTVVTCEFGPGVFWRVEATGSGKKLRTKRKRIRSR